MICNVCKKDGADFVMYSYNAKPDQSGDIAYIDQYVEYYCSECGESSYKLFVYEIVGSPINLPSIKCNKCGNNDKFSSPFVDTPVMECENECELGLAHDASLEFVCKCSFFKRTKNKLEFKVKLVEVKDINEIPESLDDCIL